MEMQLKRDPYNSKEKWESWISSPTKSEGVSDYNFKLILTFLKDFEQGKNIHTSSIKGERSPIRLMALKSRLMFFGKQFKNKKFILLTKNDVHKLFTDMRSGKLKKENGKRYSSAGTYVKDFKTFWNWLLKTGKVSENITQELSRRDEKPAWVYLTEEQFKTLANQSSPQYRALIWLMYDSGMRVTEAYSIKVGDFSEDYAKLTIREETSKNNCGRTINLKLCSSLIKEYVQFHHLNRGDFLFQRKPPAFNKYLKTLSKILFGTEVSHPKAKETYNKLTLYDIRHSASCYWLKRYPNHSALMYRMGWTSENLIKYYSEFLGMSDQISDENMVTTEDKTKFEKENESIKQSLVNFNDELKRIATEFDKRTKEDEFLKKVFKKITEKEKNRKYLTQVMDEVKGEMIKK